MAYTPLFGCLVIVYGRKKYFSLVITEQSYAPLPYLTASSIQVVVAEKHLPIIPEMSAGIYHNIVSFFTSADTAFLFHIHLPLVKVILWLVNEQSKKVAGGDLILAYILYIQSKYSQKLSRHGPR